MVILSILAPIRVPAFVHACVLSGVHTGACATRMREAPCPMICVEHHVPSEGPDAEAVPPVSSPDPFLFAAVPALPALPRPAFCRLKPLDCRALSCRCCLPGLDMPLSRRLSSYAAEAFTSQARISDSFRKATSHSSSEVAFTKTVLWMGGPETSIPPTSTTVSFPRSRPMIVICCPMYDDSAGKTLSTIGKRMSVV